MTITGRRTSNEPRVASSGVRRSAARHLVPFPFLLATALAVVLRFPSLGARPMHADEAVNAAKFARLLERGEYRYDPKEFHGPTLNYVTLVPAALRGQGRYEDLDEVTLRSVPAAAGSLLVAAHILLVPIIGFPAAVVGALLTAASPAMVYYSRYYIHETLLLLFGFGALISVCRYLQAPRMAWAASAGACAGLMHATKETWVIAVAAIAAALCMVLTFDRLRAGLDAPSRHGWRAGHLAGGVAVAVAVSTLFFSSFLSRPEGLADSVTAFTYYLDRAGDARHVQPWPYYFDLLVYSRADGGPVWTEALIVGLALVGLFAAFGRRATAGMDRTPLGLLGAYAVLMAVVYSAIPYKTPWCLLGFLHGLILVAGVGAVRLATVPCRGPARIVLVACLAVAGLHLGWQAWTGSFRFAADPRNPYVYAHTTTAAFQIGQRVEALALAHPKGLAMPIEVVSRENLWPLPWYFRRLSAVKWETAPVEGAVNAPVILTTPEMETAVARRLYDSQPPGERELYVTIFDARVELRPQVEVRGYAAKALWDDFTSAAQPANR